MSTICVVAQFTQSGGQPATGLALADIDMYLTQVNKTTGVDTVVWDGTQNPTFEIDNCGSYGRLYALADFSTYSYHAVGHYTGVTALDTTYVVGMVDQGDPLESAVPGIYTSGMAGYVLANIHSTVWDEVLTAATHNIAASSGRRLRQIASNIVIDGTAVTGTTNTIQLDAGASAVDGAYDPSVIVITGGLGSGQCRLILEYDGATKTAVIDRDWKQIPNATSTYMILGDPGREHVNEGLATGGGASSITLNALASSDDDAYIGQRVFIRSGTGSDQARRVYDYDGVTKVALVTRPWDTVPDATSAYVMLPTGAISDLDIENAVWDAVIASHLNAGSTGDALDSASTGGDPWSTLLPGAYGVGTAGYALAKVLACGCGTGASQVTYVLTDVGTGLPISDADIWVTTDAAGANVVAAGQTDAVGEVEFWLDAGTTYYVWRQKDGYTFTNPDTEAVP